MLVYQRVCVSKAVWGFHRFSFIGWRSQTFRESMSIRGRGWADEGKTGRRWVGKRCHRHCPWGASASFGQSKFASFILISSRFSSKSPGIDRNQDHSGPPTSPLRWWTNPPHLRCPGAGRGPTGLGLRRAGNEDGGVERDSLGGAPCWGGGTLEAPRDLGGVVGLREDGQMPSFLLIWHDMKWYEHMERPKMDASKSLNWMIRSTKMV